MLLTHSASLNNYRSNHLLSYDCVIHIVNFAILYYYPFNFQHKQSTTIWKFNHSYANQIIRHLVSSLVSPGVCVSLVSTVDCFIYLFWTLILTAVLFLVCLTECRDFDCRFFRSSDLYISIWTTDFCIWNGAYRGCDRSIDDACSP
jgi:hypothetical protein